jgi:hypothetical protein
MVAGWVELDVYCAAMCCPPLNDRPLNDFELKTVTFDGASVPDVYAKARAAGWWYDDWFWVCPKCAQQLNFSPLH